MELQIAKQISPETVAVFIAVVIYLIDKFIVWFGKSATKAETKIEENTQAVRELNINLKHFSDRIVIVEDTIKKHDQLHHVVWELKKDMTYAFEKIRELKD